MKPPQTPPLADTRNYMAVCGFCLAVILLVQLQAGIIVINALTVAVGAMALVGKLRAGPILVIILVMIAQLAPQIRSGLGIEADQPRASMALMDVLLCAAVLGYVAGHYRLQGIWHRLLPVDTRQRFGPPRRDFWLRMRSPAVKEARPGRQITPQEITWLVIDLPLCAVLAQVGLALLPKEMGDLHLPVRLMQLLTLLWLLGVGFLVAITFLGYLKQRSFDAAAAQMYLQDQLWRDTRGEQRRVNRWLSWWIKKKSL